MSPVDDIARLATAVTAKVLRNLADAIDAPLRTNVQVVHIDNVDDIAAALAKLDKVKRHMSFTLR